MKVALVHDYIKEYGGAEKVLEALHELFPDAPVYTSVYLPQYLGPHAKRFANWDIRTSYLQNIPGKAKLISPFRLLSKSIFQSFDFSGYDVIITSATGAYLPNSIDKKKAKLICYCHTPPRYLYGYATARVLTKNVLIKSLAQMANHILRMHDFETSANVDQYIANSEEVANRIKKFYRKDSVVVYPPAFEESRIKNQELRIEKKNTKYQITNSRYYVAGGRLARPKHIDLIIKACLQLEVPLKIFGKGFAGYGEELSQIAHPTGTSFSEAANLKSQKDGNKIEFLGEVREEEKWELYRNAKALLFASEDEDFGIMPVESMAAGTPVIAYRSGGVQETVIDKVTGLFYDELKVESLVAAIKQFDKMKLNPKDCQKRAEKFSKERFMNEMKKVIENTASK